MKLSLNESSLIRYNSTVIYTWLWYYSLFQEDNVMIMWSVKCSKVSERVKWGMGIGRGLRAERGVCDGIQAVSLLAPLPCEQAVP